MMDEGTEKLQENWLKWQTRMAKYGLKVNTTKTETMVSAGQRIHINIVDSNNVKLKQVNEFKYLGVTLSKNGGSEEQAGQESTQAGQSGRITRV